jgi:hypothetical protein
LLLEHEREAISSAEEGVRMEYIVLRNTFDSLQQGRLSPKQFAQIITIDFGLNTLEAADIEQQVNRTNWDVEIAACNTAFGAAMVLATAPYDQALISQWSKVEIPRVKAQNTKLTLLLMPALDSFFEGIERDRVRLAGIQCLTAVRRYALTHGSLPNDLEVATREAGLKAVPTDPYSGGPMLYKVIDNKPIVYSVGYDRKDDGGVVDWDNGKKPGDFIFRIRE